VVTSFFGRHSIKLRRNGILCEEAADVGIVGVMFVLNGNFAFVSVVVCASLGVPFQVTVTSMLCLGSPRRRWL